jgi:mannitol-1-/sugar-/sorbitol-6-phosphatase
VPVVLSCEAILFDLDGVLVDSHKVVERTWRRWIARHGIDAPDIVQRAHGRRSIETVREVAPELNADDEVRWLTDAELGDFDGVVALPGAEALLDALRAGEWAVVTSGGRELARQRLAHANLLLPDVLIAAEDVAIGKPAPDGYLKAARELGRHAAKCLVIEDTPPGIQAGRAAGAHTVALTTTFPSVALGGADMIVEHLDFLKLQRSEAALLISIG